MESDLFLTSDQHYGHRNVIKYCRRPFAINFDNPSYEEILAMNDHMVKMYNDVVGKNGKCLHVGDFSLGLNSVDTYGPQLLGQKEIIPGNHDWIHPMHIRKAQKIARSKERFKIAGFQVADVQKIILFNDMKIKVCHLPYWEEQEVDGYEGRFKEWRPVPEDENFLICGHVHQHWKIKRTKGGRIMYNVGVDVQDFKPVAIEQVVKDVKEFDV